MASFKVEVDRQVRKEVRRLPGHMRQRTIRALKELSTNPRPRNSRRLNTDKAGVQLAQNSELRRIRMMKWRIIYLVEDDFRLVSVLAIRKRPPYQYEDLNALV